MELVKNIFFNTDRLTANSTVKISYTGILFQNSSKEVTLKYTFGDDWDNYVEAEMIRTELGFQTEIELQDKDTFGFCFRNENNEWDNNNGDNYTFIIEHPETSLMVIENLSEKSLKHLRKTYIWSKKIKLAIYKLLITIPKILTGNYKKKSTNQ